jgi:dephospho-CoA kinase
MNATIQARPFIIGLTGGIASGKSAVAELFAAKGVPVFDTDQIARDVVEPGTPGLAKIVEEFGPEVLDADGRLNRKRMRQLVFADPAKRRRLEAITHPAIRAELARRSAAADGLYQIHVVPLLVESGRVNEYARVLVVDAPEADQLRRLLARDGTDEVTAQRILEAQASRADRLSVADDVIVNTGTLDDLRRFVDTLHENYELLAAAHTVAG